MDKIKIAVLGAGGLGKACLEIVAKKKEAKVVAICNSGGYLYSKKGISLKDLDRLKPSKDSIGEIIRLKDEFEGIFAALPNLPNEFVPGVVKRFIKAGYSGVYTCALKRTTAIKLMMKLDSSLKKNKSVYIAGCGATPGLLSAAAVLAAQSFIKVEDVNIRWGVGISNWNAYRATIREDIAHLPGYTVNRAKRMTDRDVDRLLNRTDGKLVLRNMEHADDILLKNTGVIDSLKKVSVGGVMDTRHAKKPVSTTMTLTGTTFEGKKSSHRFILGDETSMAANVVGPALGYLKRALWLKKHKIHGIFGSTDFMPMILR
ncbi:MAG: saccharopine dehydrogenase-like oxidoreductase [Candidatus Omnitrophica bacterium]|nr:saccharopine dehydrogenase-like oxidoreductase [Candidatus Omnitrophota bacterium]MBU4457941.1 saccharopine dehydrogenase-like oxidoreductase [Candidatus Omnitrophota bacterium]